VRRFAPASVAVCLIAFVSIVTLAAFQRSPYPPAKPAPFASPATSAKRGEQLVMLGGCHDCHTPKLPNGQPDMSRMLSGHPQDAPLAPDVKGAITANMLLTSWRGPWGMTLTRNITPDKETGIGAWSLADFKKTIRTGVDPQGNVLNPPMPIFGMQNLPDQDLEAIYNYLMTIKPIHNAVGRIAPPAPAKR
jgi:mono/diheme cytochrome c family protein